MLHSESGHNLETVSDSSYLCLQISEDLKSLHKHIVNTTNKASTTLGLLRRNLKFLLKHHKTIAYQSLVKFILENCSFVWDPGLQQSIQYSNTSFKASSIVAIKPNLKASRRWH